MGSIEDDFQRPKRSSTSTDSSEDQGSRVSTTVWRSENPQKRFEISVGSFHDTLDEKLNMHQVAPKFVVIPYIKINAERTMAITNSSKNILNVCSYLSLKDLLIVNV